MIQETATVKISKSILVKQVETGDERVESSGISGNKWRQKWNKVEICGNKWRQKWKQVEKRMKRT